MSRITKSKYFKTILFFIYEGIYLIFIDFFNQYLVTRSLSISGYLVKTAIIFNVLWVLLYFIILYMLNPKPRKIVSCVINVLLLIISIINYFMNSYFHSVFSWKDLFLSGDGLSFLNSVFKFINLKLILFILTSIDIILLIFKTRTRKFYQIKSKQSFVVIPLILIIMVCRIVFINVKLDNASDGWDSREVKTNLSNYYKNWIVPENLLRLCGTYEYLIKDFNHSFFQKDDSIKAKEYVSEYISENKNISNGNNYNGIFKNKNLIFVMMESMDDWMVNEEITPTIYNMMQHGFNFNNHYSPGYVTGETANTEFIANTGMYPSINKLSPNYAYVDNSYPYSIANLFKKEGYITNSFH